MRRLDCPFIAGGWIGLPDEWLGKHIQRRDQAIEKARELKSDTLARFAASLAILEDWGGLPGLDGNTDNWDFTLISARLINWIKQKVEADFLSTFLFPEISSPPSQDGSNPEMKMSAPPGTSETGQPT